MFIEILNKDKIYSRFYIDFNKKVVDIETEPNNKTSKMITDIFTYPDDGFIFNFKTISTFLKNRGIVENTKDGVYKNIDDDIKIVVIN